MKKIEDKDTRYYIDIDLESHKIINWDYDKKQSIDLVPGSGVHRTFLSKGQYHKLILSLHN